MINFKDSKTVTLISSIQFIIIIGMLLNYTTKKIVIKEKSLTNIDM